MAPPTRDMNLFNALFRHPRQLDRRCILLVQQGRVNGQLHLGLITTYHTFTIINALRGRRRIWPERSAIVLPDQNIVLFLHRMSAPIMYPSRATLLAHQLAQAHQSQGRSNGVQSQAQATQTQTQTPAQTQAQSIPPGVSAVMRRRLLLKR